MSFRPRTILRLRSRTSAMLIAKPSCVMPNSLLRRKYDATLALWMMFLLGRHAMFGHEPPTYLRSTTTTRCPFCAEVQAISLPPAPLPSTRRSCSSVEVDVFIVLCIVGFDVVFFYVPGLMPLTLHISHHFGNR